jgi:hypothetical protein
VTSGPNGVGSQPGTGKSGLKQVNGAPLTITKLFPHV